MNPERRSPTRFALGYRISPRWGWGLVIHEVGNVTAAQLMFGQVAREQVVRRWRERVLRQG